MRIGPLASVLIITALTVSSANSQSVNMEREYKLDVSLDAADAVWTYLQEEYGQGELFPKKQGRFTVRFSEERFLDRYFDTPCLKLLHTSSGVRHRERFVPHKPESNRHERQRIQIKLERTDTVGDLLRTEITFNVRTGTAIREPDDQHPLLSLVRRSDRSAFRQTMHKAGIDADRLKPILLMDQQRRRMYLDRNGFPFAQFSLDVIEGRKWWRTVHYAVVEVALDEGAYTQATPDVREMMHHVQETMKADLLATFDDMHIDLMPKYNRTFELLDGRFVALPTAVRIGWPMEVMIGLAAAAPVIGFVAWRHRIRRARPPTAAG